MCVLGAQSSGLSGAQAVLGDVLGLTWAERPELPWEPMAVGTGWGSETAV